MRGPVYVPVWVSVAVVALPGQVPSLVNQAVTNAVDAFLSPLTGGLPSEPADDGLVGDRSPRAPAGRSGWRLRAAGRRGGGHPGAGVRYVDSVRLATLAPTAAWSRRSTRVAAHRPAAAAGDRLLQHAAGRSTRRRCIAGSQPTAPTPSPVPVVPETC